MITRLDANLPVENLKTHLRRGATAGSIHLNVIRPFPEAAVVTALAGKKRVIVLERTDEAMAGDNPIPARTSARSSATSTTSSTNATSMEVMTQGFELVREIRVGALEAPDRSSLRGRALLPVVVEGGNGGGCGCRSIPG